MSGAYVGNLYSFAEKAERKSRHIMVFHALEQGGPVFAFVQEAVCVVYSDFGACIDAVLAFPQFQQPGSAVIFEIDGKAVKYHVKAESRLVVQGTVAEVPLPYVQAGGEDILCRQIGIAERGNQSVQYAAFFFHAHTADFLDDFFSAPVVQAEKEKKYQKKDTKEQVHNRFLHKCFAIYYEKLSKSVICYRQRQKEKLWRFQVCGYPNQCGFSLIACIPYDLRNVLFACKGRDVGKMDMPGQDSRNRTVGGCGEGHELC